SPLRSSCNSCCIQRPANNMLSHTRQILYPSDPYQYYRVLLEVVSFPGDVGVQLFPIGQPYPCHFAHGGVWFFGRSGVHTRTDPPSLGTRIQSDRFTLLGNRGPSFSYYLRNCWQ